jgi:hypothetical protein
MSKPSARQRIEDTEMTKSQRVAVWLVVVADAGLVAWGAMAALAPEHLLGPSGAPILAAGYEHFTGYSWSDLGNIAPNARDYMTVLFRLYGAFNVAVGVMAVAIACTAFRRGERWAWWTLLVGNIIAYGSAMSYDRIVNAIGPFEMMEYLAIAAVFVALALNAPFRTAGRLAPATG